MPKTYDLLLTENVESLGIVGDVVNVRSGYARNFLLPRNLATTPSDEKIKSLATKRASAEKMVTEQRSQREQMVDKLEGFEITLERSCNDQGLLYGSVTQQDVATALTVAGFTIRPRDVRLNQTIKRVDNYDIVIKPDVDLEATVKLHVKADRVLDLHKRDEHHPPAAPHAPHTPHTPAPDAAVGEKPEAEAKPEGKKKGKAKDSTAEGDKPQGKKTGWGMISDAGPAVETKPKPKREKGKRGE